MAAEVQGRTTAVHIMPNNKLSVFKRLLACGMLCLGAGCATTAKLNNFTELSKVGVAYSEASSALIDTAAMGSIEADTATLLVQRELQADRDARLTAIESQSGLLRDQLVLLAQIRRHQSLIKEYFVALGALANAGDADSAIGTAATNVIDSLGKLSPAFAELKIGTQTVGEVAKPVVPLIVANFRLHALEKELQTHGAAINHELMVSEGLMAFLAEKIASDDGAVQGPKEADAVFEPYVGSAALPKDWGVTRAAFLKRGADMSAVNGAQGAARQLRTALIAASEGHLAPGQLQLVVSDLNALTDVLENIKGKKK
jgi:hypothetical protein